MHCFICLEEFICLNTLFSHLKIIHGCDKRSKLKCFDESCKQVFNGLSSYKRHLGIHLRDLSKIVEPPNKNKIGAHNYLNPSACNTSSTNIFENELQNNHFSLYNEQHLPTISGSAKSIETPSNKSIIENCLVQFVLSLYNNNNFNRKDAVTIQKDVENLIISPLLKIIFNVEMCEGDKSKIENIVKEYKNVLNNLNTEYKLQKFLESRDLYKEPREFDINREISHVMINGESNLAEKVEKGILMDLKFQFRKIFEKTENQEVLKTFLEEQSQSSNISNFMKGKLWQSKKALYKNRNLVPYFLFADDFEVNNPLGSHSGVHKITGVYFSIPIFENYFKVSDIYLAGLIKAQDIKTYGNDLTIYNLVQEIISLEVEGIEVTLNNQKTNIFLIMGIILGDNLGLNQILEFSKSFSSNHYCRFCTAPSELTKVMCKENSKFIRTEENYNESLSADFSTTGIYKTSILNKIPSFHVVQNFSVDLMHDIFEGIAHYNLTHVIEHYIKNKLFTLDELNQYKSTFSYGDTEKGNVFKDITPLHLKRKKLNASAREMWTFVHHFPLIIGHLISVNDKVWEFVLIFINIIDILLLPHCNNYIMHDLEHLIEKHNMLYQKLFGDTLKPKHHNLIHYPRIIQNSGLPKYYWSFLFEAKHQELKSYGRVTSSRKNILLSIATKLQFKFAYKSIKERENFLQYSHHDEIHNAIENINCLNSSVLNVNSKHFEQIEFNGTVYKKGHYLSITNELNVKFFLIMRMIISENKTVYILCQEIQTVFSDHYMSFEKIDSTEDICLIKSLNEFDGPPVSCHKKLCGKEYIRKKHFFS